MRIAFPIATMRHIFKMFKDNRMTNIHQVLPDREMKRAARDRHSLSHCNLNLEKRQ